MKAKARYIIMEHGRKVTPVPVSYDAAITLACHRTRTMRHTSDVYEAGPDGEPKTKQDIHAYSGNKRDNWEPPVFRALSRPSSWWWYRIDRYNDYLHAHRGDERVSPVSTRYSYLGPCDVLRR